MSEGQEIIAQALHNNQLGTGVVEIRVAYPGPDVFNGSEFRYLWGSDFFKAFHRPLAS